MAVKSAHWWFIAYPDSLPSRWDELLEMTGCPIYVSPLHIDDVDENGNPKKPHYHIIISFAGPTTFNHVLTNVTEPLNATIPKPCLHLRGCFEYFTHKNNPEKAQYDYHDIFYFNGATDKLIDEDSFYNESLVSLVSLIDKYQITSFRQLVGYAVQKKDYNLLSFIRKEAFFVKCYLYS